MQATFPGVAGIYYGDEIGLNGGDEPSNRKLSHGTMKALGTMI